MAGRAGADVLQHQGGRVGLVRVFIIRGIVSWSCQISCHKPREAQELAGAVGPHVCRFLPPPLPSLDAPQRPSCKTPPLLPPPKKTHPPHTHPPIHSPLRSPTRPGWRSAARRRQQRQQWRQRWRQQRSRRRRQRRPRRQQRRSDVPSSGRGWPRRVRQQWHAGPPHPAGRWGCSFWGVAVPSAFGVQGCVARATGAPVAARLCILCTDEQFGVGVLS